MAKSVFAALVMFLFFVVPNAFATGERDDVLIIVNDNSIDSPQVGAYYALKRNVPAANIVHVSVPNQYYIDWPQFLSLRDQILRNGLCPSVAATSRPAACADTSQPIYTQANIDALVAGTQIRYIVTTRGVPTRMTVDGSTLDDSSTSLDNYLRFWLARFFVSDVPLAFTERSSAFADGRGMRIVNPFTDKEFIVGRIDGVDFNSAIALVDRAIKVETNGLYGKLYGSTFGNTGGVFQWTNYVTNQAIYTPADNTTDYWRYAFGLFGESRPECSNYTSNYLSHQQGDANGKSPVYCLAQFNLGIPNDVTPGLYYSRQPKALDAIAYFGSLDGQEIEGGFATLRNWRKNNDCVVTDCDMHDNATEQAACRAASTDPFKELNTDCVGVADGFIGYNFQSFPVSILGIWPTGWGPRNVDLNDVPAIRGNDGQNGTNSAWFSQPDDASNTSRQWVGLRQDVNIQNPTDPMTYRFSFSIKGEASATSSTIRSRLEAYYYPVANSSPQQDCPTSDPRYTLSKDNNGNIIFCAYTDNPVNHPITTNWVQYSRDITIPILIGWKNTQLRVVFGPDQLPPGGGLGIDDVSLINLADLTNHEMVLNGSFDQGHKQDSMGDYAAEFLSRLGGTAFWGSLSHHESHGHSFDQTSLGTLIYFMRGLPLGDAVWLGEKHNSGILYGDPLYSPMAVHLDYVEHQDAYVAGKLTLTGSTMNGQESAVDTLYTVDYCAGNDFYVCDTTPGSWKSYGITLNDDPPKGGRKNMTLGTWDTTSLPYGPYTLRLAVTSTPKNPTGTSQTFYDYYTFTVCDSTTDSDQDGLRDWAENHIYKTNPLETDSDHDGLLDGEEIDFYKTNPLDQDSDHDGLLDGEEINSYKTNPLNNDSDNDGLLDGDEANLYQTNPLIADISYPINDIIITSAQCTIPASISNVVDGDLQTFSWFIVPSETVAAEINIDLGAVFDLGGIQLTWTSAFGTNYDLLVSETTTSTYYQTLPGLSAAQGNNVPTTTGRKTIPHNLKGFRGRYLKVRMHGQASEYLGLAEIKVYKAPTPQITDFPKITSFTPLAGAGARAGAGAGAYIQGENFCTTNCGQAIANYPITVTINGTKVVNGNVNANYILYMVPEGATTGPIAVTTPAGTATSRNNMIIVPPPTINYFIPSAKIDDGAFIAGTNFCTTNCGQAIANNPITVTINGTKVVRGTVSTNYITYWVPVGATTGPIKVTTLGGTVISPTNFVVTP